jgi:hypothetical protein
MNELDMSRPGNELFPEAQEAQPFNSYRDVNQDQVVSDPYSGVENDVAGQGRLSDKEMNFRALREETAKLQSEREYWKGQAEAFKTTQQQAPKVEDPTSKWDESDWSDGGNVRRAFETLRDDNQRLKQEFQDQIAAVRTVAKHSDWDKMVTQHVPELTSKNPIFAEMINRASNPYEAAYLLAELNSRQPGAQQNPSTFPNNENAQRALNNAQKPQTLNSIGGQGNLSSADYYASMSDEDFMKVASKNMANI